MKILLQDLTAQRRTGFFGGVSSSLVEDGGPRLWDRRAEAEAEAEAEGKKEGRREEKEGGKRKEQGAPLSIRSRARVPQATWMDGKRLVEPECTVLYCCFSVCGVRWGSVPRTLSLCLRFVRAPAWVGFGIGIVRLAGG